jgi:pimeloyl-ACP methyl ester carboxylesterase
MAWVWLSIGIVGAAVSAGVITEKLAEVRDRAKFPPPGQIVDVGSGRRMHILCRGATPGPTLIIEQGAGSPSMLWWPIAAQIAPFARICTYDRAGYQWSDPAPRTRSLQDRVTDLHTLLAGAQIPGPFVLVAHSFGGPIARLYAHTYPDQIAGMVLVDTPEEAVIFRPSYVAYAGKIAVFARALEVAAHVGLVRLGLTFWRTAPDGFTAAEFATLKSHLARPAFFRAMADDPAALERVPPAMQHPGGFGTLGDKPLVVLAHGIPFPGPAAVLEEGWADGQERLAHLSTSGELVHATHSNHMIQSDEPELIVEAIRRVVEKVTKTKV